MGRKGFCILCDLTPGTCWYATAKDKGRLQHIIPSAEKVIGCNLPSASLQDLYVSRTLKGADKIVANPSHPGHKLFQSLPSGRRLRSIRTKTLRHKNSFFPSAADLILILPLLRYCVGWEM